MEWLLLLLSLTVWFSYRYAWWRLPVSDRFPRILMYHMITTHRSGARFNGLRVTPENFECQLAWLKSNGWETVTMSELLNLGDVRKEKTVALTFDDGFADNLHYALPLLKRYQCKATLYLVVDRHEREWSTAKKDHHVGGELKSEAKLTDSEVEEILKSGLVELGSHTMTHPNFNSISEFDRVKEIEESRRQLSERFNVPVTSFAYPFGIYKAGDEKLVKQAGYTSAVTTLPGINAFPFEDAFQLKRVKISGKDNLLAFKMRMRGGRRGINK